VYTDEIFRKFQVEVFWEQLLVILRKKARIRQPQCVL
jgi:hypothetical protein